LLDYNKEAITEEE